MALVRIDALSGVKTEMIWENPNANSINGHIPLRHAYEKEDRGTV